MKKLVLLLFVLAGGLASRAEVTPTDLGSWKHAVYCEPVKGQIGATFDVYVKLRTQMASHGMQSDLVLPEGITVAGCEIYRLSGHQVDVNRVSTGAYRVLVTRTSTATPIPANSDEELCKLTLKADAAMTPGDYALDFTENVISSTTGAAGTDEKPATATCLLTLGNEPVYDEGYGVEFSPVAVIGGQEHDDANPSASKWLVLAVKNKETASQTSFNVTMADGVKAGTYVYRGVEYVDAYYAEAMNPSPRDIPEITETATGVYSLTSTLEAPAGTTEFVEIPLVTEATLPGGIHEITVSDIEFVTQKEGFAERTYRAAPFVGAVISTDAQMTQLDVTGVAGMNALSIDVTPNPNLLILAKEGQVSNSSNVVVGSQCTQLTLTDGYPFGTTAAFTAEKATYSRTMKNEWGTLCLPYAVSSTEEVQYYEFSKITSGADGTEWMSFAPVENVAANCPAVFRCSAAATGITATATDAAVAASAGLMPEHTTGDWTLTGVYSETTVEAGAEPDSYYIKDNKFYKVNGNFIAGAFRAYFVANTPAAAKALSFGLAEDKTTGIDTATLVTPAQNGAVYDLNGRRVTSARLAPGVYVIGKKKVVIH